MPIKVQEKLKHENLQFFSKLKLEFEKNSLAARGWVHTASPKFEYE